MYRGLFLADIHIGAMGYDQTCVEYEFFRSLLKKYTENGLLDFIVVGGDFFDKQVYTADPFIEIAQRFMIQLLVSTKILRVIYGTASHESKQYSLFGPLTAELPKEINQPDIMKFDFKVINTVCEEELLPGLHVLYIPEEYVYDKGSYYKQYLSKKGEYDFIFGHGIIQEAFTGKIKDTKEKKSVRKKAPIFTAGELAYACRGEVIFGHYHVHTHMADNVSYVGSLSRWQHGEEETKGFYQLTIDMDQDPPKIRKDFVINSEALLYVTKSFGYNDPVFKEESNWEDTAKKLLKVRLQKNIYRLRVIFNIPVGYENPEAFILFFRERFKNEAHINVEFSNGYVEKKMKNANERVQELPDDMKFFIDRNVPIAEKLQAYVKMKRDVELPVEEVKWYLEKCNSIQDVIKMIEERLANTKEGGQQ